MLRKPETHIRLFTLIFLPQPFPCSRRRLPSRISSPRDGRLFDGEKEFRFISLDIPNLLVVEDNVPFAEENPWRLPDKFEINDALETLHQLGGTARIEPVA
jgi:hypothetical protein